MSWLKTPLCNKIVLWKTVHEVSIAFAQTYARLYHVLTQKNNKCSESSWTTLPLVICLSIFCYLGITTKHTLSFLFMYGHQTGFNVAKFLHGMVHFSWHIRSYFLTNVPFLPCGIIVSQIWMNLLVSVFACSVYQSFLHCHYLNS